MSSLSLIQRCRRGFAVLTLRTPSFWERSWKHRLARLAIYTTLCYLAILVFLLLLEDTFLYGPADADLANPPAGIEAENIEMTSRLGDRIHAWWSVPHGWKPEQGAVIFCHGNGGNLGHRARALPHWTNELGLAVLLFDYPGYGRSSGTPCEAGCYAAGDAAYDWLTDVQTVPAERIILYGGSLGGGTATELARRRPHRALVLVAAFTSFPDMAQLPSPGFPAAGSSAISSTMWTKSPIVAGRCSSRMARPMTSSRWSKASASSPPPVSRNVCCACFTIDTTTSPPTSFTPPCTLSSPTASERRIDLAGAVALRYSSHRVEATAR